MCACVCVCVCACVCVCVCVCVCACVCACVCVCVVCVRVCGEYSYEMICFTPCQFVTEYYCFAVLVFSFYHSLCACAVGFHYLR